MIAQHIKNVFFVKNNLSLTAGIWQKELRNQQIYFQVHFLHEWKSELIIHVKEGKLLIGAVRDYLFNGQIIVNLACSDSD